MKNRNLFYFVLLAVACLFLLTPIYSFAQVVVPTTSPFSVHPDDYFINQILKGFLGGVIQANGTSAQDMLTGSGTDNLGAIFRVFNLGVAFFGSLMVLFIAVIGVLQSGNDGEFLGRKWSSMWVPVRFSIGSMLMLPLTNSGYSFVQAMILWIAAQGIGFADTLWDQIVESIMTPPTSQIWGIVDGLPIAADVMRSSICNAAVNVYSKDTPNELNVEFYNVATSIPLLDDKILYASNWGKKGGGFNWSTFNSNSDQRVCGSMSLEYTYRMTDPFKDMRANIANVHINAVNNMAASFKSDAEKYISALNDSTLIEGAKAKIIADIIDKATSYQKDVSAASDVELKKATGDQPTQRNNMKKYGFASAGMFYIELTRVQSAVRQTMSTGPTYVKPDVKSFAGFDVAYQLAMKDFDDLESIATTAMGKKSSESGETSGAVQASGGMGDLFPSKTELMSDFTPSGMIKKLFNKFSRAVMWGMFGVNAGANNVSTNSNDWFRKASADNASSSVMQLKNRGDYILDLAGVILTGYVGAVGVVAVGNETLLGKVANLSVGVIGAIGKVLDALAPMILSMIFALIAFGFSLSIYLPMAPYLLWMGGVIGMVVLIAEALVASSLWAVMIMHPSGEGITSQQSNQGLMLLLGLFTRPALMLMGLVCGIFMIEPLVQFVTDSFFYTFTSIQSDSVSFIFSIFGFGAIYVSLVITTVNKCFSMIHIMPDKVLRWVGGGGEQLGENTFRDKSNASMAAVAGAIGSSAASMGNRQKKEKADSSKTNTDGDKENKALTPDAAPPTADAGGGAPKADDKGK
jgi:conjugal transfer/type IV secretion protein DotA/TraY